MSQLVQGGKWVFGWVVTGEGRDLPIPPEAWEEYAFREGEEALFIRGSRRSGGFGVSTPALVASATGRRGGRPLTVLGYGQFVREKRVLILAGVDVTPGRRLLAVRGSGYALGFVAQGPIHEEGLRHPELAVYE